MTTPLRYGLIGCGSFGRFCLETYQQMRELECVAVADAAGELARKTALEHGVEFTATPEELLARPDIDIVHIATPPSTHFALGIAALEAGKHVLCEKPLALTNADAGQMISVARDHQHILAVNLIMRYNPLCKAVKDLVAGGLLGDPLFAEFINAAQDETLPVEHWFWDPSQSGGIFIEHGVHFFDLFEWWFGPGTVLSANQLTRPGSEIIDQVLCNVKYGEGTLASFYHGFHQMRRRDRQHWRIIFETGTLVMAGWVPLSLELDLHVSEAALAELERILPSAKVEIQERYAASQRNACSRHRAREISVHALVTAESPYPKMELYRHMLRSLMNDQLQAIADAGWRRQVDESNGESSLAYAVRAQAMADGEA